MKKLFPSILAISFVASGYGQPVQMHASDQWETVYARVLSKADTRGLSGQRVFCSVPGSLFEMASSVSDSLGNLVFYMKKTGAEGVYVFQPHQPAANDIIIEQGRPLSKSLSGGQAPERQDTLPFYGRPDKTYLLDDYTRFSTMEEVLIEYASEIRLRKQRQQFNFQVLNSPYRSFFEQPPLVLLDGVPVFDLNRLMALDPLKIRKLEVVARKYYYGSLVCFGIVSFTSYEGDLAGYTLPPQALVVGFR